MAMASAGSFVTPCLDDGLDDGLDGGADTGRLLGGISPGRGLGISPGRPPGGFVGVPVGSLESLGFESLESLDWRVRLLLWGISVEAEEADGPSWASGPFSLGFHESRVKNPVTKPVAPDANSYAASTTLAAPPCGKLDERLRLGLPDFDD